MQQSIITALGIDLLTPPEQEEVMLELGGVIFHAIMGRAYDKLSEEGRKEMGQMMDDGKDPDVIFEYLEKQIPEIGEIIREETEKVKAESLEMLSKYGV